MSPLLLEVSRLLLLGQLTEDLVGAWDQDDVPRLPMIAPPPDIAEAMGFSALPLVTTAPKRSSALRCDLHAVVDRTVCVVVVVAVCETHVSCCCYLPCGVREALWIQLCFY